MGIYDMIIARFIEWLKYGSMCSVFNLEIYRNLSKEFHLVIGAQTTFVFVFQSFIFNLYY